MTLVKRRYRRSGSLGRVLASNTFETGTNGVAVSSANSGGSADTAFDSVSIGTGATLAYDNARAVAGVLSCQVATGVSTSLSFAEWAAATLGTQDTVFLRGYFFFTANPAAAHRIMAAFGSATTRASIQVSASGKLRSHLPAGGIIQTMTASIPLNQWFRVEARITGSAANGQIEVALFSTAASSIPTEVITSSATQNLGGQIDSARWGLSTALANVAPFWIDNVAVGIGGYVGA